MLSALKRTLHTGEGAGEGWGREGRRGGGENKKTSVEPEALYVPGTWLCTIICIFLFEPHNTEYIYYPRVMEEEPEIWQDYINVPNVTLALWQSQYSEVCLFALSLPTGVQLPLAGEVHRS